MHRAQFGTVSEMPWRSARLDFGLMTIDDMINVRLPHAKNTAPELYQDECSQCENYLMKIAAFFASVVTANYNQVMN